MGLVVSYVAAQTCIFNALGRTEAFLSISVKFFPNRTLSFTAVGRVVSASDIVVREIFANPDPLALSSSIVASKLVARPVLILSSKLSQTVFIASGLKNCLSATDAATGVAKRAISPAAPAIVCFFSIVFFLAVL